MIIGLINLNNIFVKVEKIIRIGCKIDGLYKEIIIKKTLNVISIISVILKKLKYKRIKKIIKKIIDNCMPKFLLLVLNVF